MTDEQFAACVKTLSTVRAWCNIIEAEAMARLIAGRSVEGQKLVRKRANRKWREGVEDFLELAGVPDTHHDPALKSPAQLEDLLRRDEIWETISQYIYTPEGGLAMAPESDPRDPVTRGSEFNDNEDIT